jgi:disulfide bond formation protein DsbB
MNSLSGGTSAPKLALYLALSIPAALLGGAYISQYVFGLFPCEMCWWQRWPHFAALACAVLSIILPQRRLMIGLAALGILASGLIGGFHAGVEYGWWEGLTSCSTAIDTSGNAMDAIMNAPLFRCDVAPWDLFGISLAGWNFIISTFGALAIFKLLAQKPKA